MTRTSRRRRSRAWAAAVAAVAVLSFALLVPVVSGADPGASVDPGASLDPNATGSPDPNASPTIPPARPDCPTGLAPLPSSGPTASNDPRPIVDRTGDPCSYLSIYVGNSSGFDYGGAVDLSAVRLSLDSGAAAPSVSLTASAPGPQSVRTIAITRGAVWRILLNGHVISLSQAGSAVSDEALLDVRGETRFNLFVLMPDTGSPDAPRATLGSIAVATSEASPPPAPERNPLAVGAGTGAGVHYDLTFITTLRTIEQQIANPNETSPLEWLVFLVGLIAVIAVGAFTGWLTLGRHELGRISDAQKRDAAHR
jgi:hypothetical protein